MPGGISPTAQVSSTLTPGSNTPLIVRPQQIDSPPRTRVFSTGSSPIQSSQNQPFAGLSFVDLLNLRQALSNHLTLLKSTDTQAVESTKRVIAMITEKLSPTPASGGVGSAPLLASMQISPGAVSTPLFVKR
jgi:hypothetical protein